MATKACTYQKSSIWKPVDIYIAVVNSWHSCLKSETFMGIYLTQLKISLLNKKLTILSQISKNIRGTRTVN